MRRIVHAIIAAVFVATALFSLVRFADAAPAASQNNITKSAIAECDSLMCFFARI